MQVVQIGDPAYLGFHELEGAEMSCKVIRKTDPMAKVGVVAEVAGRALESRGTAPGQGWRGGWWW